MDRQKLFLTFLGTGLCACPVLAASTAAGLFGAAILYFTGAKTLFLIALSTTIIGIFEINKFEKSGGTHNDQTVVIDKAAGMWTALSVASQKTAGDGFLFEVPTGIAIAAVAFVMFIYWKPSTIGWIGRNVKGGAGKMLDDTLSGIAAGLLGLLLVQGIRFFLRMGI
jgi:phosphatidylglycerophosphatase A